jgi:hypothetical protein
MLASVSKLAQMKIVAQFFGQSSCLKDKLMTKSGQQRY